MTVISSDNLSLLLFYFLFLVRQCSQLPKIADGFNFHVEGRMTDEIANTGVPCRNSPGDSCHYQCKIGYRLTSNPVLVCETNGSWSGVVPECKSTSFFIIFVLKIYLYQCNFTLSFYMAIILST